MDFLKTTVSILSLFIYVTRAEPQFLEINDQYEEQKHFEAETVKEDTTTTTPSTINIDAIKVEQPKKEINETVEKVNPKVNKENKKDGNNPTPIIVRRNFATKLYESITTPINTFLNTRKVNNVLRNIGTCIVNGVMELISFYLPSPLIPLIASAAGMFIPFEPVVLLKEKMPVTSYRRAFKTAMNSFMGTFDNYKMQDDEDPYMTQRFNRRFMGNSKEVKKDEKNKD